MGTMFHAILFSPVAVGTDCIQSTIFRGICLIVWDMDTAGDSGIITEEEFAAKKKQLMGI